MSRVFRYHIPAASPAAVALRRRCVALSDVKRIPVAATDTSGAACLVRARTESTRGNRQSNNHPATLTFEVDLPATGDAPARRVDFAAPVAPADVKHWLGALARGYVVDECVTHRGTWGDALLVLEDRGAGKLVLEARVPDGATWTTPSEWEGAVDVTDDPAWSRPLVTAATWPTPRPQPAATPKPAWGAALDSSPPACEDDTR